MSAKWPARRWTSYAGRCRVIFATKWATTTQHYISSYAGSHPWETWAHYLHILDTLQTAHAFGLDVNPRAAADDQHLRAAITEDPYEVEVADFKRIMAHWLPLTFAMNSLNRSMGQPDSYPFIIRPEVVRKMAFIHRVCQSSAKRRSCWTQ